MSPREGAEELKKTTKLSQMQSELGRRLVEYFVIVSSIERKPDAKIDKNNSNDLSFSDWRTESMEDEFASVQFRPTVTARYPLFDHHDNPLHENLTFFCHPSGSIQVEKEEKMPKVHYFVATGGKGQQVYGTCLTLWEAYKLKQKLKNGATKESQVYIPKCVVLLSTYPYLAAFREYLTQLERLSKAGEMTVPIERYITNFCSEVPAPPPGSFEVQTTMGDSVIKIWSPPNNVPIAWVSLPFSYLFECLDVENVILVWHCLVLERQVLITSTQHSLLTIASEIFLSLLFPMRWSHAYIPVLPHFLIPILSAPMPFLCGIHKANLADALFDLSRDCVLVDLDRNLVTLGPDTAPLPPLPPVQAETLRRELDQNVGMIFREARSLRKTDDYSENGLHLPNHIKLMAEDMWEAKLSLFDEAFNLVFTPDQIRKNILNGNDASGLDISESDRINLGIDKQQLKRKQSVWDAVQEAFLDTHVYLLRNYRKYLVFPSKHNEGSYGGAGFRSKEFIENQRYDMREFLNQFIGTQMFDNFITKRLYGSGEADVAFFDMAVDRFLKNAGIFSDVDIRSRISSSLRRNTSKDEPLIQSSRVHRKLKTIVPPEPSSEGLQHPGQAADDSSEPNDDGSVQSSGSSRKEKTMSALTRIQEKAAEIYERKKLPKYTYDTFPSELKEDLFGEPRPLPAAVIAEFDRQRKDAARFKRKGVKTPKDAKQHIHRAHATVDPIAPPSPEEATFTVFFMAFTALAGKELVEIASKKESNDRTILSTYVSTTSATDDETVATDSDAGDNEIDKVDEKEKEAVAEMKTSRPNMGGMFGDDEDENTPQKAIVSDDDESVNEKDKEETNESDNEDDTFKTPEQENGTESPTSTVITTETQPKQRFRDKLSDLEIEEAKAAGRGLLRLAFEMLTMMKRRGLKADPEAYQCLIDACGRVGDTKRATELLGKMHEDGIVADGTVYACLVSAFSADSAWKDSAKEEELPEWANSTAVEMDWNKLQKRSILDTIISQVVDLEDEVEDEEEEGQSTYQKLKKRIQARVRKQQEAKEDGRLEFFVTEPVERQITLGENLLEIVFPDISVDTENEVCGRCNFELTDDDVVEGWKAGDSNDYTTMCPNCKQRFVPHFNVQCSSPSFVGSRGPASPLVCERLSPWVLQKEIRSVMSDEDGISNIQSPTWREKEYKNASLWWNLILSFMRYRLPFTFLLQGSFEQSLIAPLPDDDQ
ncbi:hypothetical protein FisN_11Hh155 [Fistulifera solaris]|uniref:UDENN domain-containing protein n=1 Tax=Fistulifera solaris TaxID=1519565 RepID=A0A1Z5JK54_FISSO|nr:hypothetical protein FisN_11Hh155 [Fistulifera solaris]|eukprot:GAX14387.1 hypothetical protein FisN_11Hh155 [Fistulifera solaris]